MTHATHFFLGANSGQGFQNLFPRFCAPEEYHDLLVLKGGPGSGKSTMMRRIGEAMEERGEEVEYLHCSGDPNSLDGVRVPRICCAVVDGTAPHGVVPKGHWRPKENGLYLMEKCWSKRYVKIYKKVKLSRLNNL